jgi:hypothetical protein
MKTSELTGAALDWAVAKCEENDGIWHETDKDPMPFTSSTNWSQGGPIIEREKLELHRGPWGQAKEWQWFSVKKDLGNNTLAVKHGPTPLVAAMRCFVASRLGDDVDIPAELM